MARFRRAHDFENILRTIDGRKFEQLDSEQLKAAVATMAEAFDARLDTSLGKAGTKKEAEDKLAALGRAVKGTLQRHGGGPLVDARDREWKRAGNSVYDEIADGLMVARRTGEAEAKPPRRLSRAAIEREIRARLDPTLPDAERGCGAPVCEVCERASGTREMKKAIRASSA